MPDTRSAGEERQCSGKDRSEDVWCDECDSFVGRKFEIDPGWRLLCLGCAENGRGVRGSAVTRTDVRAA